MKKAQIFFSSKGEARPKDHRIVKIFAPVMVNKGKAQECFARRTLYRGHVVNIQKIQNSNSEFFVNSRRRMRLASSSVDKGKLGSGVVDTEELVCRSDHVNFVGLSFGAFLIEICKDRLVIGTVLQDHGHYLKQGLAQ